MKIWILVVAMVMGSRLPVVSESDAKNFLRFVGKMIKETKIVGKLRKKLVDFKMPANTRILTFSYNWQLGNNFFVTILSGIWRNFYSLGKFTFLDKILISCSFLAKLSSFGKNFDFWQKFYLSIVRK